MQNRPDGVELLDIARRTLLDSLLPALPKDKHYDALMIANAMAMASRELGARQAQSVPGDAAIDAFLAAVPGAREVNEAASMADEQQLAQAVRARRIPATEQPRLHQLLLQITRDKLQQSNPKYLNMP